MKRFRFTLQTVLDVRRTREEKIQKEFGAIQAERVESLRKIASFEEKKDEVRNYQRELREKKENSLVTEDWCLSSLSDYTVRIMLETQRLKEIEKRLEEKRLELVQAQKARKVLERVEEKQRQEYMKKVAKEEQGFLDELAQHSRFYAQAH